VTRRAPTIRLSRTTHPPRQALPHHEHRNAYLSIVVEGDYVEHVGSRTIHCRPLHVRFHPSGEVHADNFGVRGGHVLNIELDDAWNAELDVLGLTDPADGLLLHDGVGLAFHAWRNRGHALLVEDAVAGLLDRARSALRETRGQAEHAGIRKAIEYVHESAGGRFSLFDAAAAAGLHATHLSRIFRQRMGCTIGVYARRVRVARALQHMHAHPAWPLSRVAVEAGFTDHPHLSREFQRVFGTQPSRLRNDITAVRAASTR